MGPNFTRFVVGQPRSWMSVGRQLTDDSLSRNMLLEVEPNGTRLAVGRLRWTCRLADSCPLVDRLCKTAQFKSEFQFFSFLISSYSTSLPSFSNPCTSPEPPCSPRGHFHSIPTTNTSIHFTTYSSILSSIYKTFKQDKSQLNWMKAIKIKPLTCAFQIKTKFSTTTHLNQYIAHLKRRKYQTIKIKSFKHCMHQGELSWSLAFTNVLSKKKNKGSPTIPSYSWIELYKEAPKHNSKSTKNVKRRTHFEKGFCMWLKQGPKGLRKLH